MVRECESNSECDQSNVSEFDYGSDQSDNIESDDTETEEWSDWDEEMIVTDLNNSNILTSQRDNDQQPQLAKQ